MRVLNKFVFENSIVVQTPVGAIMVIFTPPLLSFQVLLAYLIAGDLPSFIASLIEAREDICIIALLCKMFTFFPDELIQNFNIFQSKEFYFSPAIVAQ